MRDVIEEALFLLGGISTAVFVSCSAFTSLAWELEIVSCLWRVSWAME